MVEFDLIDDPTTPSLPSEVWEGSLAWPMTLTMQAEFQRFYDCVVQGNRRANLTRILEPMDFWEKHLWDSLRGVLPFLSGEVPLPDSPRLVDIGTGGGFPGIPLAIARPDWSLTLLDSTQKKVRFLQAAIAHLQLSQVQAIAGRAETLGALRPYRGGYDVALLRAVAAPSVCLGYARSWLKPGGWAVLYRGQWRDEEQEDLQQGLQGFELVTIDAFVTPQTQATRHSVMLRRLSSG
ncbi:16S rRNA (guanine(527)-N(7))-methyltransferase RsmG [Sodalinema gerasimenkoae]|uniref:16S rRNA (guanine(527)-N(7))-methyltransferase RsmG n=1 Tax=Sodalinema gerasimenkoae TaxID=2862348 RepID=UPI001CA478BE|nr:16S rRNA (guanine(527)-N(7))-methyltransferase RsmG [Sodalinema gerasimenkoae]